MKKFLFFLMILAAFLVSSTASAFVLNLSNWQFNPSAVDGSLPGTLSPVDEITFLGSSFIDQNGQGPGTTFTDQGFFSATSLQNDGAPIPSNISYLGFSYEVTGIFQASGINTTLVGTDQNFVFYPGGTLDLYLDTSLDYGKAGTTADHFGANNGTKIASFVLTNGNGDFDFDPAQMDGQIDIYWEATDLLAGVWFNEAGEDLSVLMANPDIIVGAFTDSNNNLIEAPPITLISETLEAFQVGVPAESGEDFYTSNDGSYNPTVIPEPTTIMLFGMGLLGLAGFGKKKLFKK